jgi:hypothetical protein
MATTSSPGWTPSDLIFTYANWCSIGSLKAPCDGPRREDEIVLITLGRSPLHQELA